MVTLHFHNDGNTKAHLYGILEIRILHVLGIYLLGIWVFVSEHVTLNSNICGNIKLCKEFFLDVGELLPLRWKLLIKGITPHTRVTAANLITFECVNYH
jgi:hypothetical protein